MSITNVTELETILTGKLRVMTEALDAVTKERDALALDAARYRWLRVNPEWLGWEHDFRPDEVEKEIDAAMKGKS